MTLKTRLEKLEKFEYGNNDTEIVVCIVRAIIGGDSYTERKIYLENGVYTKTELFNEHSELIETRYDEYE